MKTIYKVVLVIVLYLVYNTTFAQILPYTTDGKNGCIECETETEEGGGFFFYFDRIHIPLFEYYLPEDGTDIRRLWLRQQELVMAQQITGIDYSPYNQPPPNFNFNQIQFDYFMRSETNTLQTEYVPRITETLQNTAGYSPDLLGGASINSAGLHHRIDMGSTNPGLGDLKYNGKYLRDLTNTESINFLTYETTVRNAQRLAAEIHNINAAKLNLAQENNMLSGILAQKYIDHYNNLGVEDAVRFMGRYMIADNEGDSSINTILFGSPSNIFRLEDHNFTNELSTFVVNLPQTPVTQPQWGEMSRRDAFYHLALRDDIFDATSRSTIQHKGETIETVKNYWYGMQYSHEAMGYVHHIMSNYKNGQPFPFDKYPLQPATQIDFHNTYGDTNPHLLAKFRMNTQSGSGTHIQYRTDALLHSLYENDFGQNPGDFFGGYMTNLFVVNNIDKPSYISNQDLHDMFQITEEGLLSPPNPDFTNDYTFNLMMRNNHAATLWNLGIQFPAMLQLPYVVEGLLALNRGEVTSFDFAFRKMVYDLRIDLELTDAEENWLIAHPIEAGEINQYYSTTNNANFTTRALDAFRNGGDAYFNDEIILDPNVTPCVKDIINQLRLKDNHGSVNPDIPNGGNEHIAQIILDMFDDNPDYTLIFEVKDLRDPVTNELINANGRTTIDRGKKEITIEISSKLAEKGTDLHIAKTIIHESIHGWMKYRTSENDVNFVVAVNSYFQRLQIENPNAVLGTVEHEFMGYVHSALSESLAVWGFHKKSQDYYDQISRGGLESSTIYQAFDQTQKDNIQQVLKNERTGNSQALGEKCP